MEKKIRKLTFEEADEEYKKYFLELNYEQRIQELMKLRSLNLGEAFNKPIIKKITIVKDHS